MTTIIPTVGRHLDFFECFGTDARCAHIVHVHADGRVNVVWWTPDGDQNAAHRVELIQGETDPPLSGPYARWMGYQVGQASPAKRG